MEVYPRGKAGLIEVICGPMFSGKTEELIRRLRRAKIARQRAIVFKPQIDKRYDEVLIVSHTAQKIPSIPVADTAAMKRHLTDIHHQVDVVGIDEAQFFDNGLIQLVDDLANRGLRVVVAGLDQDYLGNPFGPIPHLLAIADLVSKQYAICLVCGAPAGKTQRVKGRLRGESTHAQVQVGAIETYEARCRLCHVQDVAEPVKDIGHLELAG